MISEQVEMLVSRMKTNPDEFINKDWDPVDHGPWSFEPFEDTRWGHLMKSTIQTGKEYLFSEEELEVLKAGFAEILRTRTQEAIVKELVSGEKEKELSFKQKQTELPYVTTFSNVSAKPLTVEIMNKMAGKLFDKEYKRYRKANL